MDYHGMGAVLYPDAILDVTDGKNGILFSLYMDEVGLTAR